MCLTATFISILLLSAVAGMQLANFASGNFFPEQIPSGIRITSAGTVEGTNLIQQSGNVYTLRGDIHETIVVLRDGIVLDGAGYTLQGSGNGSGVFLQDRNGVTIKNLKITNFQYGIKFTWLYFDSSTPKSNTVSRNTIANNTYGIMLMHSSEGNVFSENLIVNNTYGVSFSSLIHYSNHVFRHNKFDGNDYSIVDQSDRPHDIDTSNTVNSKPIYYWFDQQDKTVPSDAGFVALKNCRGITVQGLELDNNGHGVLLCHTTDSKIVGNILTENAEGITLRESSNNEISENTINGSRDNGIHLSRSNNNIITKNNIQSTGKNGVHLDYDCTGNTIAHNEIADAKENGIYLSSSPNSVITGNKLTQNKLCGICLKYDSDGNIISGNHFTKNGLGLLVETVGSTITENTMINNDGWAIRLNGSQGNNLIHHNNFIENNVEEGFQVSMPAVWSFYALNPDNDAPRARQGPTLGVANPNVWDDGEKGNYWSDYALRYSNASEMGNTGVGDTAYFINENNIDRYPLMAPYNKSIAYQGTQQTEFTMVVTAAIVAVVLGFGLGFLFYFIRRK